MIRSFPALIASLLLASAACSGPTSPNANGDIAKIEVVAVGNATGIPPGRAIQFMATAVYKSGERSIVTSDSVWQSSNPLSGPITSTGMLQATAVGAVDVRATYLAVTGQAHIDVRNGCEGTSLSIASVEFPAAFSGGFFTVNPPDPGCRWKAESDADWLRFNVGDGLLYQPVNSGEGGVPYSAAANSLPTPRTGHMTVSGIGLLQVVTVTQKAN